MSDERVITLQYALAPTRAQAAALSSHVGAVRFAFNYALGKTFENWEAVKADPTVEYINVSAYSMRKLFNTEKGEVAPWWAENSKEAYSTGFANFHAAMQGFFKKRAGVPRFKSKRSSSDEGVTFTTGVRRLEEDRRHFTIPVVGTIRLHERATKLAYLLRHEGRITNVTIKHSRTRWFLNVTVRVSPELWEQYHLLRTKQNKKKAVGVDVGIKHAAVFSDGTVIENPRAYEQALKKLRRQQKELSRRRKHNKRTGEKASNRYEQSRKRLQKTYAKVTNQELDFTHKLSKQLVDQYEIIGLENLNIAGMMRNRTLARHIAHANFGRLRSFTEYKADQYGSTVILTDRFYPSSKTCSQCGTVKATLSLAVRTYDCDNCGLTRDRDLNAAINIQHIAAQSCGEAQNGHGEASSGLAFVLNETPLSEVSSGVPTPQPELGNPERATRSQQS